jgi:hypothetical protein
MSLDTLLDRVSPLRAHDQVTSSAGRTLVKVEKIAAVTTALTALEYLGKASMLNDDGMFSWKINRTSFDDKAKAVRMLAPLFEYPRVLAFPQAGLLASARLIFGRPGHKERALLLSVILGSAAAMNAHHRYGNDGSDQMSFITLTAAAIAKLFPNDERAEEAILRFIAFQANLGYAASGAIKLASRTWRSGRAITGVFRTQTFGDKWFYEMSKLHPAIPKLIAWAVIAGELSFPLTLISPKPVARTILGITHVFHIANARFMGLNRFVWAFGATYPAIAHITKAGDR